MRLIYFSDSLVPSRSANSVQVMQMCAAFGAAGAGVTLFARRGVEAGGGDPFAFYGVAPAFKIRYLPCPPGGLRKFFYGLTGALWARATRPGLVYGRSLEGCRLAAAAGLSVVYEAHAPDEADGGKREGRFRALLSSPGLLGLVVISEPLKKHFESAYGPLRVPVHVLPDAANEPRRERGAPPGAPGRLRVGYVGHIYPGKGMETILELAGRCPWAEFHVVGGGDCHIALWKGRARHLDNLVFHGYVPPSRTDALRLSFDILIAPYGNRVTTRLDRDIAPWMSPLKLFEYMAAGKPILCSDLPVLREVMEHERNALLCRPEDAGGWAAALERLRNDPELCARLAKAAYEDFRQNYTWARRAGRILELYAPPHQRPRA